ncbi:hypothetical protein NDK47_06515 [Brevibacillus ruminantium]|uniref:Uncharacterized protein n=1 Tax=Brevibacillus ruminantium TaxID=2950604 RepID=A0ABY4WJH9_9BACL|nr:hypothetical protein [Brevibacillus ruminantium]USG66946.1 hypothetical protein NDK47_06515 [Brevibacillus ruminantium]
MQPWGERILFALQQMDGSFELWIHANGQTLARLEHIQSYRLDEANNAFYIQKAGGWDAYSADLKPLTNGSYDRLEILSTHGEVKIGTYRDKKTGLLGILGKDWKVVSAPVYESIKPFDQVFPQLGLVQSTPAPFVFLKKDRFGYLSESGAELFQTALLTKRPAVTYQPLTAQPFAAFQTLLQTDPLRLVDFGKAYGWESGRSSETNFFANLALYLELPAGAAKQEVLAALIERGVLAPTVLSAGFANTDFYALMYSIATGGGSQSLTQQQLADWASKRGLVYERGGHHFVDVYAEYQQLFFRELLRVQAGRGVYKAKTLTLATLDEFQRSMLSSLIVVNGRPMEQLPVPLPADELNRHLNVLIQPYNKQAQAMLQAAVKQL